VFEKHLGVLMRWVAIVALAAFCAFGFEQHPSAQDATDQTRLPDVDGLDPVADLSPVSLAAARGDVLRWRDDFRRQYGPAPNICPNDEADGCLPTIEGYFIVFAPAHGAGEFSPGSIVRIILRDDGSETGAAMVGNAQLVAGGRGVCGATMAGVNLADVAYLGDEFSAAWVSQTRAAFAHGTPISAGARAQLHSANEYTVTQNVNGDDAERYSPGILNQRGFSYSVDAHCGVSGDGSLACGAFSPTPPDPVWGLIAWASRTAEEMRVAPQLKDGTPSAGTCLLVHLRSGF
jgi:hypothetical protein